MFKLIFFNSNMQFIHSASNELSATYLFVNSLSLESGSRPVSLGEKFCLENEVYSPGTQATEISGLSTGQVLPLPSSLPSFTLVPAKICPIKTHLILNLLVPKAVVGSYRTGRGDPEIQVAESPA